MRGVAQFNHVPFPNCSKVNCWLSLPAGCLGPQGKTLDEVMKNNVRGDHQMQWPALTPHSP
jgi:hypothetical protein